MSVSNAQRHDLHSGLEEVLGSQRAEILMDYLPPVGWADVATKRDLDGLEDRLTSEVGLVRAELKVLRTEVTTDVDGMAASLDAGLSTLSAKLDVETANRRTDIANLEKSMEALKGSVLREQRIHLVVMIIVLSGIGALINLFG